MLGSSLAGSARGESRPRLSRDSTILSERVIEREIRVPKTVRREEIVEKVVVVPEKVVREETVDELRKVREKIIEVARPIVKEKYVTVPRIEYVEKIKKVPEIVYREVVKKVPRKIRKEKRVEVPRINVKEKIVEVPEISYRDVIVEKVVEIPTYEDETVIKEVKTPQYVQKLVPRQVTIEVPQDIKRTIPVPVEAVSSFEFSLSRFKPDRHKIPMAIYIPRFIEVPVPAELLSPAVIQQAKNVLEQIANLSEQKAPNLTELEEVVRIAQGSDFAHHCKIRNIPSAIEEAWRNNRFNNLVEESSNRHVI